MTGEGDLIRGLRELWEMTLQAPPEPLHVNPRTGELSYRCPICGDDRTGHLRVDPKKNVWYCYKHGEGGTVNKLRRLTGLAFPMVPQEERDAMVGWDKIREALLPGPPPPPDDPTAGCVDYAALCRGPYSFGPDACRLGGLGDYRMLVSLMGGATALVDVGAWAEAFRYVVGRGLSAPEIEAWGLRVVLDPGAPFFHGRVIFPGFDPITGYLRGFQGRMVAPGPGQKYMSPLLAPLNFPVLYGPKAARLAATRSLLSVVLVEGPFDAVVVERVGFPCASIMGKQLRLGAVSDLKMHGVRRATVLLDNDVERWRPLATAGTLACAGVEAHIAAVPAPCKDAGQAGQECPKLLWAAIETAPRAGPDALAACLLTPP